MGGTTSHSDHLEFPTRPTFQAWTLDNVRAAIERWRSFHRRSPCYQVSRRQFFEIFSDYGVCTPDGGFLSVPLEYFAMFDTNKSGRVPALEVFFLLLLFCHGEISDKISTAFEFFDQQEDGYCAQPDMILLIQACLGGMHKVGITGRAATKAEVEELVSQAFLSHDTNVDQKLSLHEFIRWARNQIATQAILSKFGSGKSASKPAAIDTAVVIPGAEVLESIPTPMAAPASPNAKLRRRRRKRRVKKLGGEHEALKRTLTDKSLGRDTPKSERPASNVHDQLTQMGFTPEDGAGGGEGGDDGDDADLESSLLRRGALYATHADVAPPDSSTRKSRGRRQLQPLKAVPAGQPGNRYNEYLTHAAATESRAKAMTKRSLLNKKNLRHGAMRTEFTMAEVGKLATVFAKYAGVANHISKETFLKVMKNHMPGLVTNDEQLVEKIFRLADPDGDHRVQFNDFCMAMNRTMRGSMEQRLQFVFELFGEPDPETKELCMGVGDLVNLIKQGNKRLNRIVSLASTIMRAFDEDSDGDITQDEFLGLIGKEQAWLDAFANFVSLPPQLAKHLHICMAIHSNISHASMLAAIQKCYDGKLGLLDNVESLQHLGEIVNILFGPVSESDVDAFATALEGAYKALVATYNDFMVRDVINCWAKVATADVLSQVMIFFKCTDADGSGSLDRHEIMHMLLTTQRKLAAQASLIIDMLIALDEDGDGTVSLSEFMNQSRRHPLVLSSLDSLFQVNRNNESGVLPSRITFTTHSLLARSGAAGGEEDDSDPHAVTPQRRRALLGRFAAPPTPRDDARPSWNRSRPTPRLHGAKPKPAPRKSRRPRTSPSMASTRHSDGTQSTPVLPATTGVHAAVLSSPKRGPKFAEAWRAGGGVAVTPSRFDADGLKRVPSGTNLKAKLPLDVVGAHLTRTASRLAFAMQKKEDERRHKALKDAAVASALRRIQSKPRNKLTLQGQDLSTYMDLQPGLERRRKARHRSRTPVAGARGTRRFKRGSSTASDTTGGAGNRAPESDTAAGSGAARRESGGGGAGDAAAVNVTSAELNGGDGVVQDETGAVSRVLVSPIRTAANGPGTATPLHGRAARLAKVGGAARARGTPTSRPRTTPSHKQRTHRATPTARPRQASGKTPVATAHGSGPRASPSAAASGGARTKAVRHNRYR